jgi:hypothetical protein
MSSSGKRTGFREKKPHSATMSDGAVREGVKEIESHCRHAEILTPGGPTWIR